jgi:hypothetical protein
MPKTDSGSHSSSKDKNKVGRYPTPCTKLTDMCYHVNPIH